MDNMKIYKKVGQMRKVTIVTLLFILTSISYAQDNRTVNTRVADLLARMPVYNRSELVKQMDEMTLIGDEGRSIILSRIVPPGTGDDTSARFAIESYSRYLSEFGNQAAAEVWERECTGKIKSAEDKEVISFFLRQLIYIGQKSSSELAAGYLADSRLCEPALAVITSARIKGFDKLLAEKLSDNNIKCAAGIMNTLADWNPDIATDAAISWYNKGDADTRAAALRLLSHSSSEDALKTVKSAALAAGYSWDPSGATPALLEFARKAGDRGDLVTLKSICSLVLKRAAGKSSVQYRIAALGIEAEYTGLESMNLLYEAFLSGDTRYRQAAIGFAREIPGPVATRRYLSLLETLPPEVQADLIVMLGDRGDPLATESILNHLFMSAEEVRVPAALALAKLEGKRAVPHLIDYMRSFPSVTDQVTGMLTLSTITDSNGRILVSDAIAGSPDITKSNLIYLLSLGGENLYFEQVHQYCSSDNQSVRMSAYEALPALAGPANSNLLVSMLSEENDQKLLPFIQAATAKAIRESANPETAIAPLINELDRSDTKEKIIPVLPMIGGKRALKALEAQFESGTAELRALCFDALAAWPDYSVTYTLFDIVASGNKTYEEKAFQGFARLVNEAPVAGEQKLLLFRKIMPYAVSVERKKLIIAMLSSVRTFQNLVYLAGYLGDMDVAQVAARGIMNVALPSGSGEGFYGSEVKAILERTAEVISGEESEYYRQRILDYLSKMPSGEGFVSMFNGRDLSGWQGLVGNPVTRSKMSKAELARKQEIANREMLKYWSVKDGAIWFSGEGANLCSIKEYGDFEMIVDWRITKKGDSGIYLRGTPQVQIWDTSLIEVGARVGSGGLYNNTVNESKPLLVADNPVGDWNSFRIVMNGERVTVWLNGIKVVDNVVMENYWDRSQPIFPSGAIELQAHGNELAFRDIYIKEIESKDYKLTPSEKSEGFVSIFNGKNLDNWIGDKSSYVVEDGLLVVKPGEGSGGNLYNNSEYSDFILRFEFQLTPGANNGLGIRAPLSGDAAYVGMELQILDNTAEVYADLQPYQYHGSVYGVIPARRGFLKPVGEWNSQEVIVKGTRITVNLNGNVIVDGDIADARENGTMDHLDHPGLMRTTGYIGFLGHGSSLKFRNIRIREL